jgi:hypothetical protein
VSIVFPTNKAHISFSEIKNWAECPYRHKLLYVDKIQTYEDNPYADFGTIVHEEIENFLKGEKISQERVDKSIEERWAEKKYDKEEHITKVTQQRDLIGSKYVHDYLPFWKKSAKIILEDLPGFLNAHFPNWEYHMAEQQLYESIEKSDLKFKGFIDCIIKVPKAKNSKKYNYWIIDWKTTGKTGWYWTKRKDFTSLVQIGLYKKFWSDQASIPLNDIKTAFVFLKRGSSPGKSCELFKVSTGPKFLEKSEKLVNNMIKNVEKNNYLKNYNNCKFCPFKKTEHCSGNGW